MTTYTRGTEGRVDIPRGAAGTCTFRDAADVVSLMEECFALSNNVSALLHADNLPPGFFDVSSQQSRSISAEAA